MKQFWFIGVTTGQSLIMRLFPIWEKVLGIQGTRMHGVDLPPGIEGQKIRETVNELRANPDILGALVTTHKLAVWEEASDLFAKVDEHAARLQEISCISKDKNGKLIGHAKDPITSCKAMESILGKNHWQANPKAEAMVLGCGGAGTAIIEQLLSGEEGNIPLKITGLEQNRGRLEKVKNDFSNAKKLTLEESKSSGETAAGIMTRLPPHSLIINATGMGKDLPGSPVSKSIDFPEQVIVWELNYRGSLEFYQHAKEQETSRKLRVHNGWDYFLLGWSSVMKEVFHFELTEPLMNQLKKTAKPLRIL
tara:strand:- start:181 stop:1101 length:921 start_codon:yes stop_codon:yes gene_type:complete